MKSATAAKTEIMHGGDRGLPLIESAPTFLRENSDEEQANRDGLERRKPQLLGRRNLLFALFVATIGLAWLGVWVGRDLPTPDQIPYFHKGAGLEASRSPSNAREANKRFVRLADISRFVPKALVAAEDRKFYSHFGINFLAILRAAYTDIRAGRIVEGGSTITEQLAKNVLPHPGSLIHQKLQEIALALEIEHQFSKKQILEFYLNKVYFGSGTFGIYAASHRYFGKSPKKLDLYEAAILVGLLPAPSRFNPRHDPQLAARRAKVILNDMVETGVLTPKKAQEAITTGEEQSRADNCLSSSNQALRRSCGPSAKTSRQRLASH